jgi:hypothetical protein
MLIISPFSDYYDGVASSGIDTTIRYHRQTTTIKATSPFYINYLPTNLMGQHFDFIMNQRRRDLLEASLKAASCHFQVVGFCGTHLVSVRLGKNYYFGESILDIEWSKQKPHGKPTAHQIIIDLIQKFHGKVDHQLFQQFQVPVFVVPMESYIQTNAELDPSLYQPLFTLNPNLKELQFPKYKDAYSAFQEIQGYISGILGADDRPTVELSDRSKILKAGFDPKISFCKGKT